MATAPKPPARRAVDYPTSDGKPMAETALHWQIMVDVVEMLRDHFIDEPMAHIAGNLLLFYEEGNRRKHVAPDAFFVRGLPKLPLLDYYLLWEVGKPPDVVIEITSKTTRREDQKIKHALYRDVLKIPEYFQFDPTEDYLRPSLQGVRRIDDEYVPIELVDGRLPSAELGLHLERVGAHLRYWDPATERRLLTREEQRDAAQQSAAIEKQRAAIEKQRAEAAEKRLAVARREESNARHRLEEEIERLRREVEAFRRGAAGANGH